MNKQSYEVLSKFGQQPADIELFLSGRKSLGEKDDNTPWLITLADLLTILLVFSFVIISVSNKSNLNCLSAQTNKNSIGSLVSVAEATVSQNSSLLAIPLSIYKSEYPKSQQRTDDEKIIMRNSFIVAGDSADLNDAQKSALNQLAQICRINPSSKIIISANIDESSQHYIRYAKNIINYLTAICNVDKGNVLMQPLSDVAGINALSGANAEKAAQHIEVKLLKDFWSL